MRKTKIDWYDSSFNPVTGCLHNCEYCYARRIAERLGWNLLPFFEGYPVFDEPIRSGRDGKIQLYPFDFFPTFHRYKLDEPKHWKKPRTIFVCSMADLFGEWVPDEWIREVFEACKAAPQHRYLFLTKNPARYIELAANGIITKDQTNLWFGSTTTTSEAPFLWHNELNMYVSIEPILAPFKDLTDDGIVRAAKKAGIPVFMKDSLRQLMGDDFRQEFPWEV